ncbi:MAG: C45 family peptidase [Candidatus Nomurabacteria bacterium]|jgi:predicted choloylglycine hydrolase|nr:C45 family peptidase [Candidatus Nomurabacteria bacterium]
MRINKFAGTSREVGEQLGKFYEQQNRSLRDVQVNEATLNRQLAVYKKHYPELLEEIGGVAVGGNFDLEKLLYVSIAQDVDQRMSRVKATESCTIFGVKKGDKLLVGRNYDWLPQARDCFHIYEMDIAKRYKYIGITDMTIFDPHHTSHKHWSFSAEDAINDQGLYIGLTYAFNQRWSYGLASTHIIRLVAETCGTVAQALKVFRKTPLLTPKNFFIADKYGNMAAIEHTSKTFRVVRPDKDGILIQTNHYTAPDLLKEDSVFKQHPAHTTYLRYYETLREIKRHPDFKFANIRPILRNTHYVYADSNDHQTIWSLAMDMTSGKREIIWDDASGEKERAF